LNFDHKSSFLNVKVNKFCFNDDSKRDLTVYESTSVNTANILSHIEVKLLYPAYSLSKRTSKITELLSKIECNKNRVADSGWFFIIWTSVNRGHYKSSDAFFDDALSDIRFWVEKSHSSYHLSSCGMTNIINGCFDWRGDKKEIIVKAVAINSNEKQL
jgi:hypothetical protein